MAIEAGFVEAGWVGLPHHQSDLDAERFAAFVEGGRAGTMEYLGRRNEAGDLVRSNVQVPFPWARSVIVCLASYQTGQPLSIQPAEEGKGWIARYAWSGRRQPDGATRPSDYHKVLLRRLHQLEAALHAEYGEFEARAYVDTGPVVERSIARAAGVGWTGKNTCLIHPRLGSWNFLAVLVTSVEVGTAPLEIPDRCGSCRRCLDACPTGALTAPYQMDANLCISYLTIEHRDIIADELKAGMGRQVFGCDICQDVCPWNRKAPLQPGSESELVAREELVNPTLEWLANLDFEEFEKLFNGSPLRRTGFLGLRRNVAIAMGNAGLAKFLPWLRVWAGEESQPAAQDAKSVARHKTQLAALREASRWALDRIANSAK
jgi:epoxyqueuosine reductase